MPASRGIVALEICYVLLVAFLMVSRIPHFSGKQIGRVPREYFIPVLFGVAALILLLATFPMEVLVGLSLVYVGLIPMAYRRFQTYQRADEPRGGARLAGRGTTRAVIRRGAPPSPNASTFGRFSQAGDPGNGDCAASAVHKRPRSRLGSAQFIHGHGSFANRRSARRPLRPLFGLRAGPPRRH